MDMPWLGAPLVFASEFAHLSVIAVYMVNPRRLKR
jgi:hypothetical protein